MVIPSKWSQLLSAPLAVTTLIASCTGRPPNLDRKSTRLNSSHSQISYAVFCLKKKKTRKIASGGLTVREMRRRTTRVDRPREGTRRYTTLVRLSHMPLYGQPV